MSTSPIVEHYAAERIPNPDPEGPHAWQVHYTVWNAIVRACLRHGRVGPFHERPITDSPDVLDIAGWPLGARTGDEAEYWVIDDWLSDERYVYLEVADPGAFTAEWLRDLMRALGDFPGWGAGVAAFADAYVLVFGDKLMVTGELFERCGDLDAVVQQARLELAKSRRPRDTP
jgi:hypothetical protein